MSRVRPPKRGDLVRLNFDPQTGHEQSGFRPALVISNSLYNEHSSTIVVCPITSRKRDWPFEIALPPGKVEGFVLVDQVRVVDWRTRKMRVVAVCPDEFLLEIDACLDVLFRGASQDA